MANRLILMQGIPGSGKSTAAKQIAANVKNYTGEKARVYSTDDYWMKETGEYLFDGLNLAAAHAWNQKRVATAMHYNLPVIIVDNTNITRAAAQPYLDLAEKNGYDVEVARITCDPGVAWQRNTHGVPLDKVIEMHAKMEDLL